MENLFGGENAEEHNALLHVIKGRGYDFLEKTPVTTMTVRLIEDLHKLGYKIEKQGVSGCFTVDVSKADENLEYSLKVDLYS